MAFAASVLASVLVIASILIISHFVDATVARLTTRELTETAAAEVLYQFVDGEPIFAGAWFVVEANALDGNDANVERDGWLAHPDTGHFRPYVYNFGNGAQCHHLTFADAEGAQSDYYRVPLTSGQPYVMNPGPLFD
ncbi:hypothetical protein [Maricaulis sp.]|uniref:hypothetical protein n=1 Tax=Maricaulis sp. TaxID=1486257 RepID=UPI001B2A79D1|nr:hypothetical protein [Maricaulis sp.]MBO6798486.1 hypothetical protein [Maricaulis sp.]